MHDERDPHNIVVPRTILLRVVPDRLGVGDHAFKVVTNVSEVRTSRLKVSSDHHLGGTNDQIEERDSVKVALDDQEVTYGDHQAGTDAPKVG